MKRLKKRFHLGRVSRTIACLKRPLFLFGLPRPKPSALLGGVLRVPTHLVAFLFSGREIQTLSLDLAL